jgi:hypothetical protein
MFLLFSFVKVVRGPSWEVQRALVSFDIIWIFLSSAKLYENRKRLYTNPIVEIISGKYDHRQSVPVSFIKAV